jgi:uroporphyrinogen decarboxylase
MDAPVIAYWGLLEPWFNTDDQLFGPGLPLNVGLLPAFERKVLEDKGTHWILQDGDGAISEQMKPEYGASIPHYLRYAIETRADWERLRDERLNPDHPDRLPPYLDARIRRLRNRDYPLSLWLGSLYGWVRNWMGVERISLMVYDDRPLVEEIMEHLTQLTLTVLGKLAGKGLEVDQGDWWEDMCYNHGSLLSPRVFAELMVPRYKRIGKKLHEHGIDLWFTDCDGDVRALLPGFLESGINCLFPFEVNGCAHPAELLNEYGKDLRIMGRVDKIQLGAGKEAIKAYLETLVPLVERGGYIPFCDHRCPPNVKVEDYLYYLDLKEHMFGM